MILKILLFILGIPLMGFSFWRMPFRDDERDMFWKAFNLNIKDADGNLSDGMEEAYARIGKSWKRLFHDIKNIIHEWVKSNPKVAAKFFSFIINILLIIIAIMGYFLWI